MTQGPDRIRRAAVPIEEPVVFRCILSRDVANVLAHHECTNGVWVVRVLRLALQGGSREVFSCRVSDDATDGCHAMTGTDELDVRPTRPTQDRPDRPLLGRLGALDDANRQVALAERVQPTPSFQHHARRLVAETARANGWGDSIAWLRDAYSYFETRGDDRLASSCRSLLGTFGAALPRQRRSDERVPPRLRALGVSAREADVLELLADARSTRSIAETLQVSPKMVERHIANLATKLGLEGRTAVVAFAAPSTLELID